MTVLRHARRLVHEDDAEDLAQRVWLKVLRSLPAFRGESQVATWLYVITRHMAATTYRHNARRTWSRAVPLTAAAHLSTTDPAPDLIAFRRAAGREILAGLKTLPQHEQLAMRGLLRGELGDETAARLGIPAATVKSRRHRARRRLLASGKGGES